MVRTIVGRPGGPALKPTRFRLFVDPIEALSECMAQREFHLSPSGKVSATETLWHRICTKDAFDLEERYVSGEGAFFAYTQTLANDCVSTSS
jgi:hypothetical protein